MFDLPQLCPALPHAQAFYSLDVGLKPPAEPEYPAFQGELLGRLVVEGLLNTAQEIAAKESTDEDGVCQALDLLRVALDRGVAKRIRWKPERWFLAVAALLQKVSHLEACFLLLMVSWLSLAILQTNSFFVVDRVIKVVLLLGRPGIVSPSLRLDQPAKTSVLLTSVGPANLRLSLRILRPKDRSYLRIGTAFHRPRDGTLPQSGIGARVDFADNLPSTCNSRNSLWRSLLCGRINPAQGDVIFWCALE